MLHQMRGLGWAIAQGSSVVFVLAIGLADGAIGQIVPDDTLGAESSRVTPNVQVKGGAADRIEGGATRGANLFHSFRSFNVGAGQRVYFNNPAGVRNILSRVTGNDGSNILGTLGVEGGANLFLLNPNGIVFDPNARLDVRGSFLATTADRFVFPNEITFGVVRPEAAPLLNVGVPIGLQYGRNPGAIASQATLVVSSSQSLILAGGEINLDNSFLGVRFPQGGRIELGSVGSSGIIGLNNQGSLFSLNFPADVTRADVLLNNSTLAATAANRGDISINARNIAILRESYLFAGIGIDLGSVGSRAGDLTLNATGSVTVANSSIGDAVFQGGLGNAGNLTIRARDLTVDSGEISASTFGMGDAGNIVIQTQNDISLSGSDSSASNVSSSVEGGAVGKGGDIQISARSLSLTNGAQLATVTNGQGDAGNIYINIGSRILIDGIGEGLSNINGIPRVTRRSSAISSRVEPVAVGNAGNIAITTGSLFLNNGAQLSSGTFGRGNAGNVLINAHNAISLDGSGIVDDAEGIRTSVSSAVFSNVESGARGTGGNIEISATNLSLTDGAQLVVATLGNGNAGNIIVSTSDSTLLDGRNGSLPSAFFSLTASTEDGQGGNIHIETHSLSLTNGAQLQASTYGAGNAGSITIYDSKHNTENSTAQVFLSNSTISTAVNSGAIGQGGAINLQTNSVSLTDNAQILASTQGQGRAGDITVTANTLEATRGGQIRTSTSTSSNAGSIALGNLEQVNLIGNSSGLFANTETSSTGQAGSISIGTRQLNIQDNAEVAISSQGSGQAGRLDITARNVSLDRGRITAETVSSQGGDIALQIANSLQLSNNSNISASTASGQGGNVRVNARNGAVQLHNGSQISARSTDGTAGDVTVNTRQLTLADQPTTSRATANRSRSQITASTDSGRAGNVTINARYGTVQLSDGGQISARSAEGRAGDVTVNTRQLSLNGDAQIAVNSQGQRRAGNLNINATSVSLDRGNITAETISSDRGGGINLQVGDALTLRNHSQISASTRNGQGGQLTLNRDRPPTQTTAVRGSSRITTRANDRGNAGNLSLNTQQLTVQGAGSAIAATSRSRSGGNVTIDANQMTVANGAAVSTSTRTGSGGTIRLRGLDSLQVNHGSISALAAARQGDTGNPLNSQAGSVRIHANDSVQLSDRGSISVENRNGGIAGDLNLNTGALTVQDRSRVTVSSPDGKAGNLTVTADRVGLNNGELTAATGISRGKAGANIRLNDLSLLQLRNDSRIAANANRNATGGNITINSEFIVAPPFENSDITANAGTGTGGRVDINTQGVFGIAAQLDVTPQSDITASSDSGVQGVVAINRPNVDPSRGLTELPTTPIDTPNQLSQVCPTNTQQADRLGSFIISGRGGLPPSPTDLLSNDNILSEWVTPGESGHVKAADSTAPSQAIVEAQSWVKDANGVIHLVAAPTTPAAPTVNPEGCRSHS